MCDFCCAFKWVWFVYTYGISVYGVYKYIIISIQYTQTYIFITYTLDNLLNAQKYYIKQKPRIWSIIFYTRILI